MDKTESNLQSAFAGEAQAYIRYALFSLKADLDGFPQMAKLFRAAAEAEMIHARNHFNAMGGIGTTKDNLLAAATSEHQDLTRFYPAMIEQAQTDRNERARSSFNYALKAEQTHNLFFEKSLQGLKANQPAVDENYFVCHTCGNLVSGAIPDRCPNCSSPSQEYKAII